MACDLSRAEMTPDRKDNEKTSHMPTPTLSIHSQFGRTSFLNQLRYETQMQQDVSGHHAFVEEHRLVHSCLHLH